MLNKERVIYEIRKVGLYDLVLQDIQKITKNEKPTKEQVSKVLEEHPRVLRDYMQTNVEYNLTNIHLKDIDLKSLPRICKGRAEKINNNLNLLKNIEKYTLDFEQSSTLVIIFSIEFFVLFSVQYFIVLLNLKEWQLWIYGLFSLSIVAAWMYARKEKKKYIENSKLYTKVYEDTLSLIEELEKENCFKKEDLYIMESDEHI